MVGLSAEEAEEWEKEGKSVNTESETHFLSQHVDDRVQWHRALAEMLRWMEEFEMKHVEFSRTIRSFLTMTETWTSLAKAAQDEGMAAFARHQAGIYRELYDDSVSIFRQTADPRFVEPDGGDLLDAIKAFREGELSWLRKLASAPSDQVRVSIYIYP
jgi:hypothetical protein